MADIAYEADKLMKRMVETAQLIKDCGGTFETAGVLARAEQLFHMKELQKRHDDILEECKAEETATRFEEAFNTKWETVKSKSRRTKNTKEFKEFKKQLRIITNDDINDDTINDDNINNNSNATPGQSEGDGNGNGDLSEVMEVGGDIFSLCDPWSKGLMKNPMLNVRCGHNYDYDSVMSVIKDNMSIKCPVPGCSNKSYIQPNHLKPNKALLRKIEQHIAEQSSSESSSSEEDAADPITKLGNIKEVNLSESSTDVESSTTS